VPYESTLSQKLRDAGAVILGKTVLTELANWVSDHMPANYSAVGARPEPGSARAPLLRRWSAGDVDWRL
jgi:amidase